MKKIIEKVDKYPHIKKLLLIMQLSVLLILIAVFSSTASVYSQVTKLTLKMDKVRISEVFDAIEDQSEFVFFYNKEFFDDEQIVTVDFENKNIDEVLEKLFKGRLVDYEIYDRNILMKVAEKAIASKNVKMLQQQQTVTGKVRDKSGQPLPGVTIVLKGTTQGTITDSNGDFALTGVTSDGTLVFSFVGMKTQEIEVGSQTRFNVVLEEETIGLEEVIAIGYGTKEKGQLTGSVANVKGEALTQIRTTDLIKSLQGMMPGIIVNDRGGAPGSEDAQILIRGTHTLGNNSPLIVIDGVPRSGFGQLSPEDIEEISVLKDASAAIYGARAANGVIIVRTKRGRTGQFTLEVNSNYGVNSLTRVPELMDSWEWATYQNEVLEYYGQVKRYSDDDIQKYKTGSDPLTHPNTNFYAETFRDYAPESHHNISATGGTESVKYFISGDYLRKESQYSSKDGHYNQYQLRSNIDAQVQKYINIGMDISLRLQEEKMPPSSTTDIIHRCWFNYPYEHAYYPNGLPGWTREGGGNPIVMNSFDVGWNETIDKIAQTKLSFDLNLEWITDGLALTGYAAYDFNIINNTDHRKPVTLYLYNANTGEYEELTGTVPSGGNTSLAKRNDVSSDNLYHIRLQYDKGFGDHNVSAFAAYEQSESDYTYMYAYRKNLFSTSKVELFAGEEDGRAVNGSSSVGGRVNYFGYLSYDYMRKYMIDFTIRHDGSFNFPKDKRFGTFPAVTAGWNISKEPFMSGVKGFADNIKLRVSYGEMGNDRIPSYQYLTKYGTGSYYIFGESPIYNAGMDITNVPNTNITWEVAKTWNTGFDAELFNGSLSMGLDYFYEKRRGILIRRSESVPAYTALELPQENLGKVDNSGIELVLNHARHLGDIAYNVGGNLTFNRSKIVYMDEPEGVPEYQKKEGYPVNSFLAYETDGIFNSQAELDSYPHLGGEVPGGIKYIDINEDGKIDDNDMVRQYTSATPEIQFGVNMGIKYKGFGLFALFQGQARATLPFMFNDSGTKPKYLFTERWTPDNPDAVHPRPFQGFDSYQRMSTYHFNDASFVRLKNLELSYDLASASWLTNSFLKQCRLYLRGRNLWTLDHVKYFDPEAPIRTTTGTRPNSARYHPQLKTYSLGINITL